MTSPGITLLVLGVVLQVTGAVLVTWQDFAPFWRRLATWLSVRRRRLEGWIRRLLRRPRGGVVHEARGAAEIDLAGRLGAIKSVSDDASLDQKVEFLLRRDREAQQAETKLGHRIDDLDTSVEKRLKTLRRDIERHHEQKLSEALAQYRPMRIRGTVLLAAGLVCTVLASFA